MAMPHMGHVVVCVRVLSPFIVIEILHPAADDLDRVFVGNTQIATEKSFTCGQCVGFVGNRRESTGETKGCRGQTRVNRCESRQTVSYRSLADLQVLIVGRSEEHTSEL